MARFIVQCEKHSIQWGGGSTRLEEVEEIPPRGKPRVQVPQLLETTLPFRIPRLTSVLGRRGQSGRYRAGRCASDGSEPVLLGQLEEDLRVDNAARDPAFHDEIAFPRWGPVRVRHGVPFR